MSVLALIALLIAVRLSLPTLALREVNKKLGLLEDYHGRVDKIRISLWRGAYRLQGVDIEKTGGKVPVPFFSADAVDFSLEWKPLLHRRIVAKIKLLSPVVNFVKGPTKETSAAEPNESFVTTLKGLAPFDINRLEIEDGQIHFRDFSSTPKVDVALTSVTVIARNLRNTEEQDVALPADIRVEANAFGSGALSIVLKANPLKESPTFELRQTLKDVELVKLNDFFEAYAKIRVKKGTFGLYTEAAAKEGKFIGYAEPIFKDVVIDKGRKNPAREVWALVASAVKWVFSDKSKKQVATKIPIEGTFEKAETDVWAAAGGILKNAYIKALTPTVEKLDLKDVDKVKVKGP